MTTVSMLLKALEAWLETMDFDALGEIKEAEASSFIAAYFFARRQC